MAPLIQTARTRSALTGTHLLHTPESFVRVPLPGLNCGEAIVHACPALGAQFLWMTVELQAGGTLAAGEHTRFLYIVSGTGEMHGDCDQAVSAGSFGYAGGDQPLTLSASTAMVVAVLEKRFEPLPGLAEFGPGAIGAEAKVAPQPLPGADGIAVRALISGGATADFAVNTMTYAAGAALPQVEIHYMEHGLLMLEGDGLYLLGETWYPVQAGDFIWMAPFCPQQFMASAGGAKYLIYKNFNRVPEL